jgi:hypothetical protein
MVTLIFGSSWIHSGHQTIQFHFAVIDYLLENALNKSFATWPGPEEELNVQIITRQVYRIKIGITFFFKQENAIYSKNLIMQMRSKFTVEYLKNRGAQNSSDNRIEFVGSLLIRISCQMNFARLNRSLHAPPG